MYFVTFDTSSHGINWKHWKRSTITNIKNDEHALNLEITEVVLVHYNIVNNGCQEGFRILLTFIPDKSFRQLIDTSPQSLIFLKIYDVEFIIFWSLFHWSK